MFGENIIEKIMPGKPNSPPGSSTVETNDEFNRRYDHFSHSLSIILVVLVLIPMLIISLLSYGKYKRLLEEEEINRLLLNARQAENTVERFVVKLRSLINFAGHDDRYHELLEPGALQKLFIRLQKSYPDFTDIEVISPDGKTAAYQGNYVAEPRSYIDEQWYQQTIKKGLYISSLFEGFRGVPHFVVAIAREMPERTPQQTTQRYWVMRVNIDGKALQRYVETISVTSGEDVFLVDQDNVLQTIPKKYGKRGELQPYLPGSTLNKHMSTVVATYRKRLDRSILIDIQYAPANNSKKKGLRILRVVLPVGDTPWRLMMIKEFYTYSLRWQGFRDSLLLYFFCCGGFVIVIIVRISRVITAYIRESERKRQQFLLEAEHSNKLASIGRLAAGVAHEINNPLAIINQKAGLMEDYMDMAGDFDYKKELGDALCGIDGSVDRCKTITHRLLGFARHTDVAAEEIDINALLHDVVAFVEREASYSQITIDYILSSDLPKLISDRGQLQQIFLNILNNAIDAINMKKEEKKRSSGEKITISTVLKDAHSLSVIISDSGLGMSEETLKHLFEPFYTTKKAGKGTGLGLSISYGIIEKLGGTIEVASEIGKGSVFTFALPLTEDSEKAQYSKGEIL